MKPMSDQDILNRIHELVAEEHRLRREGEESVEPDRESIARIEVELDQCWDLLRQRRALRDAGRNPDEAQIRSPEVVEKYEQ